MPSVQQVMMTYHSGLSGNLVFEWYAQTEGLTNGAAVPQLTDTSGNTNNATQSTAGQRGVYNTSDVGGKASVTFDGGDDLYVMGSNLVGATSWTIYAVWWTPSGSATDSSICGGGSTGINYQQYTGSMVMRLASVGIYESSGQTLTQNAWHQTNVSYEDGPDNWAFRADKVAGNSGTTSHGSWSPGITWIGSYDGGTGGGANRNWHGKMAAVLVYNAAHTTAEKQTVEATISTFFSNAV